MLNSLFGRKKKKPESGPKDDSIRSARIGDVVFIPGFWDDGDDAYLIVEEINRLESAYGESREIAGVDGERHATLEWTDQDGLHISATVQDRPLGLSSIGMDYDTLVQWDNHKDIENSIEYDGQTYFYSNSYEVLSSRGTADRRGFYYWEFIREDDGGAITVVKREGEPFEVYSSVAINPHLVTIYHK